MRGLRKELADQRKVPPYVIFSDATLRELARVRPTSLDGMRLIYGVGATKLADFGGRFLQLLDRHCSTHGLSRDNAASVPRQPERSSSRLNPQRDQAFNLFRQGVTLDEVVRQTERGRATVCEYLDEFIREERPASVSPWVADDLYQQIAAATRQVGADRLKPIYLALGERVSYDDIRIVRAHLVARKAL
jgi:ATP-dependent DNA helicase RecQ